MTKLTEEQEKLFHEITGKHFSNLDPTERLYYEMKYDTIDDYFNEVSNSLEKEMEEKIDRVRKIKHYFSEKSLRAAYEMMIKYNLNDIRLTVGETNRHDKFEQLKGLIDIGVLPDTAVDMIYVDPKTGTIHYRSEGDTK